jgi:hypothetical protein
MQDFILKNNDLLFEDGDFAVGQSDAQHLELLLISQQGQWKQQPSTGCNLPQNINGSNINSLERTIRIQMEADGFSIHTLNIGQNLEINGEYL